MTSLPDLLFARLSADAGVRAVLGDPCRVYPNRLPPLTEFPAVLFHVVSDIPAVSVDGYTSGLRHARVQFDAQSRIFAEAQVAAAAVAENLASVTEDGFTSAAGAGRTGWDKDPDGGSDGLHRVSRDFLIWVRDA